MSAVKVVKKVGDVVEEYHFNRFEDFFQWVEWDKDIPQEYIPQGYDKSVFDEEYVREKLSTTSPEVKAKRGLQEGEYLRFSNKDIAKVKEEFELHFSKDVWDDIEEASKHNPYIYVEKRLHPTEKQPYIWCTNEDHLYSHSVKRVDI